jgi:hypothetical protein
MMSIATFTEASRRIPGEAGRTIAVFVIAFAVYRASPVVPIADSYYTLLVAENLYRRGSVSLDGIRAPASDELSYQLVQTARGLHYRYGIGSSILSVPFVAAANACGLSLTRADGSYDPRTERRLQRLLAALVTAATAALLYRTARLFLAPPIAMAAAFAAAFGTSLWGTASRSLWSHTWGTLLLALAVYLVARAERGRALLPILLGTVLAFGYLVRPTNAVPAVAVAVWALARSRRDGVVLAGVAALWLAAFLAFSFATRGELLSVYYQGRRLHVSVFGEALLGHLVSPSRGMLITTPVFLWVALRAARHVRSPSAVRMGLLSAGIIVAHLLVLSVMYRWWAGHAAGSRVTTELVPWFFLLACLGLEAGTRSVARAPAALPALLVAWGVFCQGSQALFRETWEWNSLPRPIDADPGRVWEWRRPEFLAAYLPPAPPDVVPDLAPGERARFAGASAAMLVRGWGPPGAGGAWMRGRSACVRFRSSRASASGRFPPMLRVEVTVARPVTLSVLVDGSPAVPMRLEPGAQSFSMSLSPGAEQGTIVFLRASAPRAVAIDAVTLHVMAGRTVAPPAEEG